MKKRYWAGFLLLSFVVLTATLFFEGDLPAAAVDAKYSSDSSQFLTLANGTRVHYRDEGNADGFPVVLIHGAMASLHTWEGWVAALSDDYRLISLDLPAHGLTGAAPVGAEDSYSSEGFTTAIHAVTESLGLTSFVLGGNSMGGGATWRYALAYPERVTALLLVNAVPPNRDWGKPPGADAPKTSEQKAAPIGFSLLGQSWFRAIARYFDPGLLIEQGLRSAYNDSPVVNEALVDRYYELMMREGTRGAILARTGGWNAPPVDLSRLAQPTLVMWGAMDSVIPVSVAYQFKAHLPNNCTIIYSDLGHIPMEEAPNRTAADVSEFLAHHFGQRTQPWRPIQTCLE